MVPSGINVPPGKFGKNNNRTPWNNRAPLKIKKIGCSLKEGVIDIYVLINLKAIHIGEVKSPINNLYLQ